jgi:hypothetical protein
MWGEGKHRIECDFYGMGGASLSYPAKFRFEDEIMLNHSVIVINILYRADGPLKIADPEIEQAAKLTGSCLRISSG